MIIKKTAAIALASTMILGSAACGGNSANTSSNSSTSAASSNTTDESTSSNSSDNAELTDIDVVLDWYPNAIHTFLFYAQEKGYFEEEGLNVNLISPADSADSITFVASERAQIGLTYPVDIINSVEQGMPVKALASVCAKPLDCMCTLKSNTEITSDLSTLKGKTIGYSGTAISEAIVRTIAKNAGLKDDDYEMINVGYDLVTSLTTEKVDLVTGIFMNDEIPTMELAGYEVNTFYQEDYGLPEMYGLVMAVNSDSYDSDPEVYQGFLRACKKGFEDMKSDEDAAIDLIMSKMNSDDNPLDETQQRESYRILMQRMETSEEPFPTMKDDKWKAIIDWMYNEGLIEKEISVSDVVIENN